jgi:hypothetical protein
VCDTDFEYIVDNDREKETTMTTMTTTTTTTTQNHKQPTNTFDKRDTLFLVYKLMWCCCVCAVLLQYRLFGPLSRVVSLSPFCFYVKISSRSKRRMLPYIRPPSLRRFGGCSVISHA